ncbi:RNA polymerase II core promoter proximal region sequence-specific binding protein [[Candida] boidinii]|nr:RNA polymerase II core promoter proximal region sequence-specific binding protein [[Candida] boidinii]
MSSDTNNPVPATTAQNSNNTTTGGAPTPTSGMTSDKNSNFKSTPTNGNAESPNVYTPSSTTSSSSQQQHIDANTHKNSEATVIKKENSPQVNNSIPRSESPPMPSSSSRSNSNKRPKRMACVECRQQKSKCDAYERAPNPCTRCSKKGSHCSLKSDYKRTFKRAQIAVMEKEFNEMKNKLLEAHKISLATARKVHQGGYLPPPIRSSIDTATGSSSSLLQNNSTNINQTIPDSVTTPIYTQPQQDPNTQFQIYNNFPINSPNFVNLPQNSSNSNILPNPTTRNSSIGNDNINTSNLNNNNSNINNNNNNGSTSYLPVYRPLPPSPFASSPNLPNIIPTTNGNNSSITNNNNNNTNNANNSTSLPNALNKNNNNTSNVAPERQNFIPSITTNQNFKNYNNNSIISSENLLKYLPLRRNPPTHEQCICQPKTLGDFSLSSEEIEVLFIDFVENYYCMLPVVDVTKGIERIYRLCPILFWTIMFTALRRHNSKIIEKNTAHSLYLKLSPILKSAMGELTITPITRYAPSEIDEPILNVSSVYTVQAFLLYTFWPPLTSSLSADASWNSIGIAIYQAIRIGLHVPGHTTDGIKSNNTDLLKEQIRTWIGCNVVSQTIATAFGYPGFVQLDSLRLLSCKTAVGLDLPDSLRQCIEIQLFEDQVCKTLNNNPLDPLRLVVPSERLPLLKLLTKQLDQLEIRLTLDINAPLDDFRRFALCAARVHLLSYYFIDTEDIASFELDYGHIQAYNASLALIQQCKDSQSRDKKFIKYLPAVHILTIWQSACIIARLVHCKDGSIIDIGNGKRLYQYAVNLCLKASVIKYDMAYRSSGIMRSMWSLFKALQNNNAISSKVSVRSRMSASFFFDCLWILREKCGMIKLAPIKKKDESNGVVGGDANGSSAMNNNNNNSGISTTSGGAVVDSSDDESLFPDSDDSDLDSSDDDEDDIDSSQHNNGNLSGPTSHSLNSLNNGNNTTVTSSSNGIDSSSGNNNSESKGTPNSTASGSSQKSKKHRTLSNTHDPEISARKIIKTIPLDPRPISLSDNSVAVGATSRANSTNLNIDLRSTSSHSSNKNSPFLQQVINRPSPQSYKPNTFITSNDRNSPRMSIASKQSSAPTNNFNNQSNNNNNINNNNNNNSMMNNSPANHASSQNSSTAFSSPFDNANGVNFLQNTMPQQQNSNQGASNKNNQLMGQQQHLQPLHEQNQQPQQFQQQQNMSNQLPLQQQQQPLDAWDPIADDFDADLLFRNIDSVMNDFGFHSL